MVFDFLRKLYRKMEQVPPYWIIFGSVGLGILIIVIASILGHHAQQVFSQIEVDY